MREHALRLRWAATWCLAITAACLPLYIVRFHIGPFPSTLLEVMIGVTVVVYLLSLWTERRRPSLATPLTIPIVLLLLAGIGGIAVAPDHTRALGIYRAYFIEAIAIFYVAIDLI